MRSDNNLEDKCFYHAQSRITREEICNNQNNLRQGAEYFQKMGCYDCSGFNFRCKIYLSTSDAQNGERIIKKEDHKNI